MERNTPEQNAALKERLEQIDWSILEHIQRKETVNERGVFAPLEAVEVPEIERAETSLKQQDWMHPGRKSRSSAFSWRTGNKTGVGQTEGNIKYRCEPGTLFIRTAFPQSDGCDG